MLHREDCIAGAALVISVVLLSSLKRSYIPLFTVPKPPIVTVPISSFWHSKQTMNIVESTDWQRDFHCSKTDRTAIPMTQYSRCNSNLQLFRPIEQWQVICNNEVSTFGQLSPFHPRSFFSDPKSIHAIIKIIRPRCEIFLVKTRDSRSVSFLSVLQGLFLQFA